jgi:hypothetical protein
MKARRVYHDPANNVNMIFRTVLQKDAGVEPRRLSLFAPAGDYGVPEA